MRVQQAGFVNRDMTTQVSHKRQCSKKRALRGVTKGLQVKSYAGDGMGPGSDEIHYLTRISQGRAKSHRVAHFRGSRQIKGSRISEGRAK